MINIENLKESDQIKNAFLESTISNRIIFLGRHGSSLYKKVTLEIESDFDLELILDRSETNDFATIKSVLDMLPFKIECQLRYRNEIEKNGLIDLTSYKIFMYLVYANSISLIGENIYKQIVKNVSQKDVRKSFLISSQIALKDTRKVYFADKSNYEVNKQVARFFICICLYFGYIDRKYLGSKELFLLTEDGSITDLVLKSFSKYLLEPEKEVINSFKQGLIGGGINAEILKVITDLSYRIFN